MNSSTLLKTSHNNDEIIPYYERVGVEPSAYSDIDVANVGFSTRVTNCLYRSKIKTVDLLLRLTPNFLREMHNFGAKCIEEVEKYIAALKNGSSGNGNRNHKHTASQTQESESVMQHLCQYREQIVTGDFSFIHDSDLTLDELSLLEMYQQAYEDLGPQLVQACVENSIYITNLVHALTSFSNQIECQKERLEKYIAIINMYPSDRKKNNVLPYITVFNDNDKSTLLGLVPTKLCNFIQFAHASAMAESEIDYNKVIRFLKWCSFNINENISEFVDSLSDREREVITARAQNRTLDSIGRQFGITRERIRQIELKVKRKFNYWLGKGKIISKIFAERNGDSILTPGELSEYFGDDTSVLLFLLRSADNTSYEYDEQLDAFIIGDDSVADRIKRFVEKMPDVFHVKKYNEIIAGAQEQDIPVELLDKAISDEYKITADTYHRTRLSLKLIYKTVLERFYPDGVNIYDLKEMKEFCEIIYREYGAVSLPDNSHAIMAQISRVGVLCGRGRYKARQEQYISKDLATRIHDYIANSSTSIFLTNTLYNVFENELISQGVNNKYYLQGILRELYGDEFVFRRDYISKDDSLTSVYSEIIRYIKKFEYPIKKSEIQHAFPGITDIVISFAINDKCILNYFGEYLHTSRLHLLEGDQAYFNDILQKQLSDHEVHHSADIYNIIINDEPERIKRLGILSQFSLFSVLEYLFADYYQFMRPYIAEKDVSIGRPGERLREMIHDSEIFDISEISEFCKENRYQIQSQLEFYNSLNETHLLMDSNTLATFEFIGITFDIAQQIEKIIEVEISTTVPIAGLACIHRFPVIKTSWNEWLVYSVLNKWSDTLDVSTTNSQFRLAIPIVAPKGCLTTDNLDDMSNDGFVQADNLDNIDALIQNYIADDLEG